MFDTLVCMCVCVCLCLSVLLECSPSPENRRKDAPCPTTASGALLFSLYFLWPLRNPGGGTSQHSTILRFLVSLWSVWLVCVRVCVCVCVCFLNCQPPYQPQRLVAFHRRSIPIFFCWPMFCCCCCCCVRVALHGRSCVRTLEKESETCARW